MKKNHLTKESIIEAALTLIKEQDVESLSFRKLGDELDVSAMAIYRHFENKQALLATALDAFIQNADVLPGDSSKLGWASWIKYVAYRMYEALIEQPSWLPLLGQLPLNESGLKVLDACLAKLTSSGFSQQQAAEAFFAMLQILFGAAICQQQLKNTDTLTITDAYPNISKSAEALLRTAQSQQIELGLTTLIAGLKHKRSS